MTKYTYSTKCKHHIDITDFCGKCYKEAQREYEQSLIEEYRERDYAQRYRDIQGEIK